MYRVGLGCSGDSACGCTKKSRPRVVRRARRACYYSLREQTTLGFDWGSLVVGVTQGVVGGLTNKVPAYKPTINATPTVTTPSAQTAAQQVALATILANQQQQQQQQDFMKYVTYGSVALGAVGLFLALRN